MMKKLKHMDLKSKLSKFAEEGSIKGPHSQRGEETVVNVSVKEFNKPTSNEPDFKEMLLNCPKIEGLEISNKNDYPNIY